MRFLPVPTLKWNIVDRLQLKVGMVVALARSPRSSSSRCSYGDRPGRSQSTCWVVSR